MLTPRIFADLPALRAGFSTRLGGVSEAPYDALNLGLNTDDDRERVLENRRLFCAQVGFRPEQIAAATQVHGDEILFVTEPGHYPGYDGFITDRPGILLCIATADCAAVLFADPERRLVGACHAGWRGTVARIAEKTAGLMVDQGASPERLRAYVSPCISAEHFEVGPEVAAQFDDRFVRRLPGRPHPHVDLKAALFDQLRNAGLSDAHVEISPHCTFARTERFFSHRAEHGVTGRMMGFIGMVADTPHAEQAG